MSLSTSPHRPLLPTLGAHVFVGRKISFTLDIYKQIVYKSIMIRSFSDSEAERFFTTGKSRRYPPSIRTRASMRLIQLNAATRLDDLRLPPSKLLETLKCDRKGQWSIRINNQWRVCFCFENGDVYDVEIDDYH
jgi:toxin HigB-1